MVTCFTTTDPGDDYHDVMDGVDETASIRGLTTEDSLYVYRR
ncbi:MAG: hypothetical protein U5K69_25650 [Balneolaceae bacterium]|nr:hypothetical protein [Balneolaceae bacterium]